MKKSCDHFQERNGICMLIGHPIGPEVCRVCARNTRPGEWPGDAHWASHPIKLAISAPAHPHGLGTLARRGIDAASFGLAKSIAQLIARSFGGKDCRCAARERRLNEIVPDVRQMTTASWIGASPKILAAIFGAGEKS